MHRRSHGKGKADKEEHKQSHDRQLRGGKRRAHILRSLGPGRCDDREERNIVEFTAVRAKIKAVYSRKQYTEENDAKIQGPEQSPDKKGLQPAHQQVGDEEKKRKNQRPCIIVQNKCALEAEKAEHRIGTAEKH